MEASLLQLVLDVAQIGFLHIAQHFREHQLQGIGTYILQGAAVFIFYFLESLPTNIKGGAVGVGRVGRGIVVAVAQTLHVFLRAQHGSHDNLVGV